MKTAFCFDLDGTVTSTEILPCIASELGIADEIATLTRATMDGHIPFEASFRLRCLILSRVEPSRIRNIVAEIPLDSSLLSFIQENRNDTFIVTGNLDIWVQPIIELCQCHLISSTGIYENDRLHIKNILNKAIAVSNVRALGYERVVAVGDGANDAPMLSASDISVAFGGVHTPSTIARSASQYIIHDGATLCKMLRAL
ncbi:HAD superfamily phosphoserine phosphatase-like hydrolase [Pseudomonas brassicacearum]|uniref:phosphoserine phosphatase n=1 Tax=Pseudomonas brassicacearum TaxID=930166 RepID=A0AAW8M414_9PSED|nr:HAD superfamily phosphoserine phosphatase-like hydrolase [Pseudomonas brassicacearum]